MSEATSSFAPAVGDKALTLPSPRGRGNKGFTLLPLGGRLGRRLPWQETAVAGDCRGRRLSWEEGVKNAQMSIDFEKVMLYGIV